ncbi:hypothetical protein [Streptomyces sp. MAR25Y5]|nr:hypothetical protein [Streptomyces sp. MAR25Y5]MCP3769508.1 hypothetical protein [Streptomyces sp. MAR25Y5]
MTAPTIEQPVGEDRQHHDAPQAEHLLAISPLVWLLARQADPHPHGPTPA